MKSLTILFKYTILRLWHFILISDNSRVFLIIFHFWNYKNLFLNEFLPDAKKDLPVSQTEEIIAIVENILAVLDKYSFDCILFYNCLIF